MNNHDHSGEHHHGSLHPHGLEEPALPKEGDAPLVEARDVAAGYSDKLAIENVNLRIWPGQFVAVVGPNGGGKTTLLKTILGAVPLMRGEITIHGRHVHGAALERVGYVPQLETIDWNFPITVEEVLLMGLFRKGHWLKRVKKNDLQKIDAMLGRLNLTGLGKRHIRELSGGQQQAVFLGRALLGDPELILLDEPTAGLDIRSRDDVIHFLHEINHQGVAIIITAHDLNWVAAHLPWAVCLNRRVVAEGKPQEVFTSAVLQETYRGDMVVFLHDGMVMIGERPHT